MNNLENLIRYILLNYPNITELSKPRLVKLIYLIDWKYTIDIGTQFTNIRWYYNHYGPYVDDVISLMKRKNKIFHVETYENPYNGMTDKFILLNTTPIYLEPKVKEVTDLFINYTKNLIWSDFINLVYSSYPIKNGIKYNYLNLKELSIEFVRVNKKQDEVKED